MTNLTALASGPDGAEVNYPQTFTTGGASPGALSYSIPSGSQFPVGTTTVTAAATDGDGRTSTSTFDVTVLPASAWQDATAIGLAASTSGSVSGQLVTFTATMAKIGPGAATPKGTVTLKDGSTTLGTGTLITVDGVTTASFTTTRLAVGSHAITAVYGGSGDLPITSPALAFQVSRDAWRMAISAAATFSVYGQPVTFQATVLANSPGAGAPTGTVTFLDGTTTLGTGTLRTSGGVTTATFTTAGLAVGSHAIAVVYGGDANDYPSATEPFTFTVAQDATTVAVAASPSASVYGQAMTFKATVAVARPGAGVPTGTVTLKDGATTIGTATLVNSDGVATTKFSIAWLSVGSHSITAVYSGDANDKASTSAASTFTVAKDATTVAIAASPSASVSGQAVTFEATVTLSGPGFGAPTGAVTFKDGNTILGTGTLSTTDGVTTASFSTAKLAVGSHAITVVYGGGPDDLGSTSAALAFNVSPDSTPALPPPATPTPPPMLSVASPGAGLPTGTMTFEDGSMTLTTLGTGGFGTAGGVATATSSPAKLAVGTASDSTSTSIALRLTIGPSAGSKVQLPGHTSPSVGGASLSAAAPSVVDQAIDDFYVAGTPQEEILAPGSTITAGVARLRPATGPGPRSTPGGRSIIAGRVIIRQKRTAALATQASRDRLEMT